MAPNLNNCFSDTRCLWCRATVHSSCKDVFSSKCTLGHNAVSILPPTSLSNLNEDSTYLQAVPVNGTGTPMLVFVNSKSGDNKGPGFITLPKLKF